MNAIVHFLKDFEIWIYVFLGLVGLLTLRKFILALREWQGTIFGLERDNAQRRLNEASSLLVLLILMGVGEFLLTSFIYPTIPNVEVLPTATLSVLTTPTVTLQPANGIRPTEQIATASTPVTTNSAQQSGCIPGELEFTYPKSTDTINGIVEIKGTVNVPDLGFYKYEYSVPGSNTWVTIAAGNGVKVNEVLGNWDTGQLQPGNYLLHLVAYDNTGKQLTPCETPVTIVANASP